MVWSERLGRAEVGGRTGDGSTRRDVPELPIDSLFLASHLWDFPGAHVITRGHPSSRRPLLRHESAAPPALIPSSPRSQIPAPAVPSITTPSRSPGTVPSPHRLVFHDSIPPQLSVGTSCHLIISPDDIHPPTQSQADAQHRHLQAPHSASRTSLLRTLVLPHGPSDARTRNTHALSQTLLVRSCARPRRQTRPVDQTCPNLDQA